MSILINKNTKLIIQGITGKEGAFHTLQMVEYGTKVVAGVTPGKGGQIDANDIPIFNTVVDAVKVTKANTSIIFVPPQFAADACLEAIDSGVDLVICITEGITTKDMVPVKDILNRTGIRMIGPNCQGIIVTKKSF